MQKVFTEERSHIFVKEPEGSSEKILKYVNCTYGRIFVPSQKQNFMIYACTIAGTIKVVERERSCSGSTEVLRTVLNIFIFKKSIEDKLPIFCFFVIILD